MDNNENSLQAHLENFAKQLSIDIQESSTKPSELLNNTMASLYDIHRSFTESSISILSDFTVDKESYIDNLLNSVSANKNDDNEGSLFCIKVSNTSIRSYIMVQTINKNIFTYDYLLKGVVFLSETSIKSFHEKLITSLITEQSHKNKCSSFQILYNDAVEKIEKSNLLVIQNRSFKIAHFHENMRRLVNKHQAKIFFLENLHNAFNRTDNDYIVEQLKTLAVEHNIKIFLFQ